MRVERVYLAAVCIAAAVAVSACGSVAGARKIDYRNVTVLPPLEVPPDLPPTPPDAASARAAGSTTYSDYAGEQKAATPGGRVVLPQFPSVRLARDGQTSYVVVNAEPSAVWDEVKEFLNRTGLTLANENPRAGLMETNWAENRALVGSDANVLTKFIGSFFSVGLRDKYNVRFERGAASGTTEIYITHRGMEELEPAQNPTGGYARGWKPRPSDPELENEMLHRLVAYLGTDRTTATASTEAAEAPTRPAPPPVSARLTHNGSGAPLLTLEDSLDRAWRRVGLSLDRIGFTVEDRDRSKGIYYVRYIDPDSADKEKGIFERLFGSSAPPPNQYQVQVKPADSGSSVEVRDKEGAPDASKIGERILSLLYEQLK